MSLYIHQKTSTASRTVRTTRSRSMSCARELAEKLEAGVGVVAIGFLVDV